MKMKTLEEFCELFREQFIDADQIKIDPETEFRTFGTWDSLTGMSILVMIKESFDVDLTEQEFRSCSKVLDVYEKIMSKKS